MVPGRGLVENLLLLLVRNPRRDDRRLRAGRGGEEVRHVRHRAVSVLAPPLAPVVKAVSDAVCPWFAACWQQVGGPARFSPAFLFLHGYHDRQYHLERRCWLPASVAFGE